MKWHNSHNYSRLCCWLVLGNW